MRINNGGPAGSLDSIVLFPFDDHSIPFQHGVKLTLEGKQAGHGNKPVVPLGEPPAHDSEWIAYYGTVVEVEGGLTRPVPVCAAAMSHPGQPWRARTRASRCILAQHCGTAGTVQPAPSGRESTSAACAPRMSGSMPCISIRCDLRCRCLTTAPIRRLE